GAAAASLYGTQAASGVIQIFTKQGSISKPQFTVKVETGTSAYDISRWKENRRGNSARPSPFAI
ncbi:MAG: hypothetical protein QGH94_19075, partial [Phycisphaerae bacterium]|nr:hypothetical protein [Phycisphaerae bacterium]